MRPKPFRRFTNLGAVIHLLKTKTITLLNPATWDDRNDAYFMAEYKRYMSAKTVLAICFAECNETYHHWKVYSRGSDGACIIFDKQKVLAAFSGDARIDQNYVTYKPMSAVERMTDIDRGDLPFLKRQPFKDEREYRVVFADSDSDAEFRNYTIDVDCIKKITLGPWMSKALFQSTRDVLRSIDGCSRVKIVPSGLLENEAWKSLTSRVRQ